MEFNSDEQYLTFPEYQGLGGTLDQMPFNLLEFSARKFIDERTSGRITSDDILTEIKLCVFELITLETSINNGIDISGNVINYREEDIERFKSEIVKKNLANIMFDDETPLLYRGV